MDRRIEGLIEAAARRYQAAGHAARHFARWKYRLDPVYLALLRNGLLPDRGRLLDLGCGQGLLLALLVASREAARRGSWPEGWPSPPAQLELAGVELASRRVEAARAALGEQASIVQGDVGESDHPPSSIVVLLDVLFYLSEDRQTGLLDRIARDLPPGGLLLMREVDADAGPAFYLTRVGERALEIFRGQWRDRLRYRSAPAWRRLLEQRGFSVDPVRMGEGTPFPNVLFVARKGAR